MTDLRDHVAEDSELSPAEKETTMRFSKVSDVVEGYTAEGGLTRRVLAHPDITVRDLTVAEGSDRRAVDPAEFGGDGTIVGVRWTAPIGLLKIQLRVRESAQHAELITGRVLSGAEGVEP